MGSFLIIFVPIAAFLINAFLQIGICRWTATGLIKSIMYGFSAGAVALVALHLLIVPAAVKGDLRDTVFYFIGNGAIYVAAGYLYFQVVNLGEASIRFRILRELRRYPNGASQVVIDERYNDQLILRTRLTRLTNNGQVRFENGVYRLQASTLLIASQFLTFMRRFLIGKSSEFDD